MTLWCIVGNSDHTSRYELASRLTLRGMTPDDVPAVLHLCRAAGWNQTADDWRCFLELGGGGCRLAEFDSEVIGSVAFLRYGTFSWIAMMLVDPARRGLGVGSQLMESALTALESEPTIRLDATPLGEPLYRHYDFRPEYELLRVRGTATAQVANTLGGMARPIESADLARIYRLDREVFGGDRAALLGSFYRREPGFAWLVSDAAAIRGYCFGRAGHLYNHIGPIVADSAAVAQELVSHCVARQPAKMFALDIPSGASEWISWLNSAGFSTERPFLRMCRGQRPACGVPGMQFGIAGPEFA